MSDRQRDGMSRRGFWAASLGAALATVAGCGGDGANSSTPGTGGGGTIGTPGAIMQYLNA